MRESLYDIPEGCICMGDGLLGVKCQAPTHAKLKPGNPAPPCKHEHLSMEGICHACGSDCRGF